MQILIVTSQFLLKGGQIENADVSDIADIVDFADFVSPAFINPCFDIHL